MAQNNDPVWQKRLTEVLSSPPGAVKTFPRSQTYNNLLARLTAFGTAHFNFFEDGFEPGGNYELGSSEEFPRDYVYQVIYDQISLDREVLERIPDQRRSPNVASLELGDRFAWDALKPAIGPFSFIGEPTTITYQRKSPSVRLLPYAPVALIGTPFTGNAVDRDYLFGAHEVGHFVFNQGRTAKNGGSQVIRWYLANKIPAQPEWANRWLEEIFADIYGCLTGGPAMALSSQDLARQNHSFLAFKTDNRVHPIAAIRPYIYLKVLNARGCQTLATQLEQRWTDYLNSLVHIEGKGQGQKQRVDEVKLGNNNSRRLSTLITPGLDIGNQPVDLIIKEILALLEHIPLNTYDSTCNQIYDLCAAYEQNQEKEDQHPLYAEFSKYLIRLTDTPPELATTDASIPLNRMWDEWAMREGYLTGPLPPHNPPLQIQAGYLADVNKEPTPEWVRIMHASGWTSGIGNSRNP